jgi:hypothetical protein
MQRQVPSATRRRLNLWIGPEPDSAGILAAFMQLSLRFSTIDIIAFLARWLPR